MTGKRTGYSAEFKARVALKPLRGELKMALGGEGRHPPDDGGGMEAAGDGGHGDRRRLPKSPVPPTADRSWQADERRTETAAPRATAGASACAAHQRLLPIAAATGLLEHGPRRPCGRAVDTDLAHDAGPYSDRTPGRLHGSVHRPPTTAAHPARAGWRRRIAARPSPRRCPIRRAATSTHAGAPSSQRTNGGEQHALCGDRPHRPDLREQGAALQHDRAGWVGRIAHRNSGIQCSGAAVCST
jgi:hypothetical protein